MAKSNLKPEELSSNWYKDRYQYVLVQRRILAAITVIALFCTFAAVLTILSLIPQKTIEPYVIQVDQKSGITQYVDPVNATQLTSDEAVKNYFIVNYIRAREGYSAADVFKQYDKVRLMSAQSPVYNRFREAADPNNSASNVARLGGQGTRTIYIKSISYLEPTLAQVRIMAEERLPNNAGATQDHFIVTMRFQFAKIGLSGEDRYVNPLGFLVTDYRVDKDGV